MAKKITELPAASSVATSDTIAVVQGSETRKATVAQLPAATTGAAGTMSAADKSKLDGIQKQGTAVAIPAFAIDWSAGGLHTKTISANSTFTFTNATSGMNVNVRITSTGPYTVTWPTVKWLGTNGATPPQKANGTTFYTFVFDGTDVYGTALDA